jgi:hypothetical protein
VHSGGRKRSGEIQPAATRASTTRQRVESLADKMLRQTREHPGRSIAMAVGAGYVLGGGLFSRLTARIVGAGIRIGLRTALLPFVTESLLALGQTTPPREKT